MNKILNQFADKYQSVLITGGTGFMGKNLAPLLESAGVDVTAVGRNYDLTDWQKTQELFRLKKYDLIIHGAAFQGAGDFTILYPADQFFKNNLIHTHVLEAWKRHQPTARLVGIGSTCSYPGNLPVLSETDYFTGPLHPSVETYGLTKCVMQQGIKAYKKQYGLQGTTVAFATLFGPHDEFDLARSHVVSALVQKFCDAVRDDLPEVEIWGDGTQTRELIYIDDQITGLLMTCDYDGELINIGSGVETQITDLAETIKELSGFKGELVYNTNRFVGVKRKVLNIDKAKNLFGWTTDNKMHTLEEALQKTINWYRENEQ
jgi:GDP-L-fucose synthase